MRELIAGFCAGAQVVGGIWLLVFGRRRWRFLVGGGFVVVGVLIWMANGAYIDRLGCCAPYDSQTPINEPG